MPGGRNMPQQLRRSSPLVGGLVVLAGTSYLTLVIAGRLLGAVNFGGLSALYVLTASLATGLFLPLEQEIARRRGRDRAIGQTERGLTRRTTLAAGSLCLALVVLALTAHGFTLRLLGGDRWLLAALCVAMPGYACCFVSRGVFAGTGELVRYGVQLGVEGTFRLAGIVVLAAADLSSPAAVGWLFGLAPWVAVGTSLAGRRVAGSGAGVPVIPEPLLAGLALLLVSSLASQLLVNAGPLVVQLLAGPDERAQAGAFLAALVVVRVPVFLFTAVQPSFLPAMAEHAANDRRRDFIALTLRVLAVCAGLTVVSTGVLALAGPPVLRLLFGFTYGVGAVTFLAMGLSVGLFLSASVLAQALLGRGLHSATTVGWLIGLVGLAAGTAIPGDAVSRATTGFLLGAVCATAAFVGLVLQALRRWRRASEAPGPDGAAQARAAEQAA